MKSRVKKGQNGDSLGDALDFLRTIWALDHQLQTASRRMEQIIGVTGPQRFVLRVLALRPGITPGEVAKILHVHPSTLTGVLQRLEKRKLLQRKVDAADARRVHLHATEAGRQVAGHISGTIEEAIRSTLGKMPRARVVAARKFIEELTAVLEATKPTPSRSR
jgi:DNA-binding MarR family transcriptional regulator